MNFGKVGAYDMMQGIGMINFLEWREINSFFVCFFLFVFLARYGHSNLAGEITRVLGRACTQIFAMRDV